MLSGKLTRALWLVLATLILALPSWPQSADTILVNGKILTVDRQFSTREAVAVRDGKIVLAGSNAEVRKLAGPQTRVIDVGGRTVIPGLIDSHMHAIRAGQAFGYEVNWVGATTLAEALGRIHDASLKKKPGAWLIVAGGWNVAQFKEKRRPTQADLLAAAPNNPVYIQLGYDWVVMTPAAFKALNITGDADLPRAVRVQLTLSSGETIERWLALRQ